jgi:hypothetical protein
LHTQSNRLHSLITHHTTRVGDGKREAIGNEQMSTHPICFKSMIIVLGSNFEFQGEGGFLISMELKGETPTLNDAKNPHFLFFWL